MLWPLLHYRLRSRRILAPRSRPATCGSTSISRPNCDKLLRPDDVIWVHDYHLIPLAKALRERGHKNRIGFFLHIPCPPPEIAHRAAQPRAADPGARPYDLVGFQTGDRRLQFRALSHARMRAAQPRLLASHRRPRRARRRLSGRHRDRAFRQDWRGARSSRASCRTCSAACRAAP